MALLYTIQWTKIDKESRGNYISIRITCLDQNGNVKNLVKIYEEWIGICTNKIKSVLARIQSFFPDIQIRCEKIHHERGDQFVKVLPYFDERLRTGKFEHEKHPFYKVFLNCICKNNRNCSCREDIARFLKQHNVAYFAKKDWLSRLYIDFCTRHHTQNGFFYQWYDVNEKEPLLMNAFRLKTNIPHPPKWKFAAFDIETVSDDPNRIPNGMDPADEIVTISVIKWQEDYQHRVSSKKDYILYLNPTSKTIKTYLNPVPHRKYAEYRSERDLLNDFHSLIQDCHVLTGYNINKFDIPCIFARLLWLGHYRILNQYSSSRVGDYVITTFQEKIVIDVYNYIRIFADYDLKSYKLDTVAKAKLGSDEGKMDVDAVGIHYWYRRQRKKRLLPVDLCLSNDRQYCYDVLKPIKISSPERFGTFPQYLEYCLRDSEVVFQLFRKERILGFLTARANFGPLDVVHALHLGNSRVLLEIFKSYGTVVGFFLNTHFLVNQSDASKYSSMFVIRPHKKPTFQGALNYSLKLEYLKDVVVFDFRSMYPTALLSSNLCYGTCHILSTKEYNSLSKEVKKYLTAIPYRKHDHRAVFQNEGILDTLSDENGRFRYPSFDPEKDTFVIVTNHHSKGFLPTLVEKLLAARQFHQQQWKETQNVFHYNTQLCIKLLLNSMYGTMSCTTSPLAYVPIAMAITNLARYKLLGAYHYVKKLGYKVCYVDTDSIMIHRWPDNRADEVNRFFVHFPDVHLNFENRLKSLLMLSKKRYIFEYEVSGELRSKGFAVKMNDLVANMITKIITNVMAVKRNIGTVDPNDGWILWVNLLCESFFMCRDPKRFSIIQKTRKLDEYKSKTCTAVKILKKNPDLQGGYIEYAYSRADVFEDSSRSWIMNVKDCQYVNLKQLFSKYLNLFITLLNIGYWNSREAAYISDMVLNTMHWKCFLLAELKHYFKTKGQKIMILVEKGKKYTFKINDCVSNNGKESKGRKRNNKIEMAEPKRLKMETN